MNEEQRQALIARIAEGRRYWADKDRFLACVCGKSNRGEEVTTGELVAALANNSMVMREVFILFDAVAEAMEKL